MCHFAFGLCEVDTEALRLRCDGLQGGNSSVSADMTRMKWTHCAVIRAIPPGAE